MTVILGLNAFHADASAVICVDGSIVCASEEERFSRIKHESGFPYRSISWCLKNAGLKISEIDHIAINSNPKAHLRKKIKYVITKKPNLKFVFERFQNKRNRSNIKNIIETFYPAEIINAKFHFIEHHLAHLASAFYASPFDTSSILSIDGFGDFASAAWGLGDKTKINIHQKVYFPHSMGVFYTSITQFLGFPNYGDEYKVMGLAPYGKPKYIEEMRKLVLLQNNGTYKLNLKYFDHTTKHIPIKWNGGSPILGKHYSDALKDLLGEPRSSKSELLQRHMDIAHSAQLMYEEALFHILNKVYENYPKEKNLCIAGGCGANSVANGKITKKTKFENVYVQAAAGDAGGALGSALVVWHSLGKDRCPPMGASYHGPSFSKEEVEKFVQNKFRNNVLNDQHFKINTIGDHEIQNEDQFLNVICDFIESGNVIGWFEGKLEWGPRALGHRSIICDPRRKDMKDILNHKIKRRESFRPFAPSVLKEKVIDWFEINSHNDTNVPYMMKVYPIKEKKRDLIPAVCHVDGTGRLQTVTEKDNGRYYRLIKNFYEKTSIPMILNTSFNENEPIVSNLDEAFNCFIRTKMDVIVLENKMIRRL